MPVHKLEYYPLIDGLVESKDRVFKNTEIKNQDVMGLGDEIKAWIVTKKLIETAQYSSPIPFILNICLTLKPCSVNLSNHHNIRNYVTVPVCVGKCRRSLYHVVC